VNRKTIYNHPGLRERIRAYTQRPRTVPPEPTAGGDSSITAALRNELNAAQARHQTEVTQLKAKLRQREAELAAVHGELHCLTTGRPPPD